MYAILCYIGPCYAITHLHAAYFVMIIKVFVTDHNEQIYGVS